MPADWVVGKSKVRPVRPSPRGPRVYRTRHYFLLDNDVYDDNDDDDGGSGLGSLEARGLPHFCSFPRTPRTSHLVHSLTHTASTSLHFSL